MTVSGSGSSPTDERRPVRVAVLGAGRIGRLHATLLHREVPGAVVAAVADLIPQTAAQVGADLGLETADIVDVLDRDDVDAVAICTSTPTHVDLIVAAAEAGKAILCEKPVSLDLADVDRAIAAVERAGVPFMVGFNRRFDPGHAAVHEAVRSGTIGEVHLLRITSRDPHPPAPGYVATSGGIFLDMTIHDFDMARHIVGSDVVEVFARGAVRVDPRIGAAGDVDTAVTLLTHADGTITTIDNSRRAVGGYDQRIEAFGSAGTAVSDNPLRTDTGSEPPAHLRDGVGAGAFLERYLMSYRLEWTAFVDLVRDGGPSPVGTADGRAPVAMAIAATRSLREGRPVTLEEIG